MNDRGLLDHEERLAELDRLPVLAQDLGHDARPVGLDLVPGTDMLPDSDLRQILLR